ncbi:MAG: hypothetical protein SF123_18860 [Chloroflexota bacterium]|nr:hypothetical protein [Chloroflexota bacterium]
MTTWKVWRSLRKPPLRHPLYHSIAYNRSKPAIRIHPQFLGGVAFCFACGIIAMIITGNGLWLLGTIPLAFSLLLFLSVIHGLQATWGIATLLAEQRTSGRFDLLATAPPGVFGTAWIMTLGVLHQSDGFHKRNSLHHLRLQIAGTLIVIIAFVGLNSLRNRPEEAFTSFRESIVLIGVAALFHIDYVATLISAVLSGLLSGMAARQRSEAGMTALAVFMGLQLVIYVPYALFMSWLLSAVVTRLPVYNLLSDALWVMVAVGVFYGLREIVNEALWRVLHARLNEVSIDA